MRLAAGGSATATSPAASPIRCAISSVVNRVRVPFASKALFCCLLAGLLIAGCNRSSASARGAKHVRVTGTSFATADRHPFQWRGITAFRLLEYVASGKEAEADRFLSWAERQPLTVVRVLAMGGGFMNLSAADGRKAL